MVLTSDHGRWVVTIGCSRSSGTGTESFHIPLIIRDPERTSAGARGRVVQAFTESVDVLPTICAWLGVEVPLQADGYALQPFLTGAGAAPGGPPDHWRTEAHWSWNFSNPAPPHG